jgi:hypothetical protein
MESDDLGLVLNGVFRMFKDGVVLPQCMPKGTAEYDGWLAKTRGHHDNKHAEEHKDGTYLATCLECLLAEPITIDDKVSKVKKRVKVSKVKKRVNGKSYSHVNDAGAFLISSPHASFFSKAPNQQDDQYSYQPPYAPICTSTIDTATATNPTATPPNPTNSIISFRAEVSSMVADERKPGGARESFHNNPLTSSELSNQICVLRRTSICFMPLCSDSDSENRDFDVALDNFFRDKASELQPSGPVSVSSSALSQQPLVLC